MLTTILKMTPLFHIHVHEKRLISLTDSLPLSCTSISPTISTHVHQLQIINFLYTTLSTQCINHVHNQGNAIVDLRQTITCPTIIYFKTMCASRITPKDSDLGILTDMIYTVECKKHSIPTDNKNMVLHLWIPYYLSCLKLEKYFWFNIYNILL